MWVEAYHAITPMSRAPSNFMVVPILLAAAIAPADPAPAKNPTSPADLNNDYLAMHVYVNICVYTCV